jgi:hypothetical protein
MAARGASSDSCASGSAARSGLPPGSAGRFSMLGATFGHIREMMLAGNYAPYNFLTIFSDGFIAVWLLALLYAWHGEVGFGGDGVAKRG